MSYKYAIHRVNYEDFSSGRVLYNQRGATAFPVRLASEIYQRCRAFLTTLGLETGYTLYDPLCGGAYLLTVIGFLHGTDLVRIVGSDIDPEVLALAKRNLTLLTPEGLKGRLAELELLWQQYHKTSHAEAMASAIRLLEELAGRSPIATQVFCADATHGEQLIAQVEGVNLVITDLPYGGLVDWHLTPDSSSQAPEHQLLSALKPTLTEPAVVAIVAPKKVRINHPAYRRVQRFSIGKREITLWTQTD
ncbi:MAG: hypothetical protein GX030_00915 [Firmicutes bacterium]|nr:hypothetical protein [Bacillota bacterium]